MRFNLMLDNPKDFYHESHRAIHFLDFAVRASTNDENTTVDSADGNKQAAGAQDSNMPDRDDFFLWSRPQIKQNFCQIHVKWTQPKLIFLSHISWILYLPVLCLVSGVNTYCIHFLN